MNLDLKKFKKVESSDHATTLSHPSGHQIKVAHHGISSELRKQLEELPMNMAKGGKINASKPSKSSNTMPGSPTMAKDAFTEPDDMGTSIPKANLQQELHDKQYPDVVMGALNRKAPPFGPLGANEKQHYPPCINPSCKSFGKSHPNCRCYGGGHEERHFAEGGKVKGVHKSSMDVERPKDKTEKKFAGESEAGAHLRNSDINPSGHQKALDAHYRALGEMVSMKKPKLHGMAEGGEVDGYCSDDRPHHPDCEYFAEGTPDAPIGEPSPEPTPMPTPEPNVTDIPQPEEPNVNMQEPQPEAAPGNEPLPSRIPADNKADLDQELDAAQAEADKVPQPEEPQSPVEQFHKEKSDNDNTLFPEAQAFKSDLDNGHIHPKTYKELVADKGVFGRIGTMFGLLLSGAGSGLAHQPNLLMHMMDQEIQRDVDAQQKSQENKQNYYKINQQNLLNKANATNTTADAALKTRALTIAQTGDTLIHYLAGIVDTMPQGSPQRIDAEQKLAMLNQAVQAGNYDTLSKASTGAALMKYLNPNKGGGGSNTMMMKSGLLGPEAAKVGEDTEEKTLSGIPSVSGQRAARPIPQQARDQATAMEVLDNKGKDLLNYIKQNSATMNPKKRAVALQKIEEMKNFYNASIQGGALTQGRLGWYDQQFTKHPTDILPQLLGSTAKLNEMVNSNSMRRDTLLNSLGFKPKQQTQGSGQEMAPLERSDKSGKIWLYDPHTKKPLGAK